MDELRQKVQTALLDDPRTKEAVIEVLNQNGVITLTGTVFAHKTSEAAEEIVKEINGVTTVLNEIRINTGA